MPTKTDGVFCPRACDSCCLLLRKLNSCLRGAALRVSSAPSTLASILFARYSSLRSVLSYTVIPFLNLVGLGLEKMVRSRNARPLP